MREILKKLMAEHGDNANSLQEKSGVPQPTTYRFLSGQQDDPRSSTVKKWAKAYGLTESQLRGDTPLPEHLSSGENAISEVVSLMNAMNDIDKGIVLGKAREVIQKPHIGMTRRPEDFSSTGKFRRFDESDKVTATHKKIIKKP